MQASVLKAICESNLEIFKHITMHTPNLRFSAKSGYSKEIIAKNRGKWENDADISELESNIKMKYGIC